MHPRLISAAAIGAHSNSEGRGFRQRDIRFIVELFCNWLDIFLRPEAPQWHNTQIMRFCDKLVADGWARRSGRNQNKLYALTRPGLVSLIHALTEFDGYVRLSTFAFVYYFVRAYGARVLELIMAEGSGYSKALQMELRHLLDSDRLLRRQLEELDGQIRRMQGRLDDAKGSSQMAAKLHNQGMSLEDVIAKVTRTYPYELESQKPMLELFREIPPPLRLYEITEGQELRRDILWQGQLHYLQSQKRWLLELQKQGSVGT